MNQLTTNQVFQTAWVVPDLEQAVEHWANTFGVGPFFRTAFESGDGFTYRGEPGELQMQVAWAQGGDTQIELLQPTSTAPNIYRDLVPEGETRFHHVCFWSLDTAADTAAMAESGYPLAMSSGPSGTQFAYFDTSAVNGHMIEILERQDVMVGLFDRVRQAADGWDGGRPLREFMELMS